MFPILLLSLANVMNPLIGTAYALHMMSIRKRILVDAACL